MNTRPHIVIVDYGVGNLWSLSKALSKYAEVTVTEEKEKIIAADAIVLPGVGAFEAGMEGLRVRGLLEVIRERAQNGIPILGICLGAQLLLMRGHEFGEHEGLGLIEGEVSKFPELAQGVTIPLMGWLEVAPTGAEGAQALFEGIEKPFFYFLHSYVFTPKEESVLAKATYGGYEYAVALGKGNIQGVQFHPEKSGEAGLKLLENFVKSIKK